LGKQNVYILKKYCAAF